MLCRCIRIEIARINTRELCQVVHNLCTRLVICISLTKSYRFGRDDVVVDKRHAALGPAPSDQAYARHSHLTWLDRGLVAVTAELGLESFKENGPYSMLLRQILPPLYED